MMTVKSSAMALVALAGASVGAYSLWEQNSSSNSVAPAPARELVQEGEEVESHRRLIADPGCADFGSCCYAPVARRQLRKKFLDAMEQTPNQQQRQLVAGSACPAHVDSAGVPGDCLLGAVNNDKAADVQGLFGITGWVFALKDDSPPGTKSGSFSYSSTSWTEGPGLGSCSDILVVFKGGAGNTSPNVFVAYKVDVSEPGFSYTTPFAKPNNVNQKKDISHISVYCKPGTPGEPEPEPEPEPDFCVDKENCDTPAEVCAKDGLTLCGASCCSGATIQYAVEAQCTTLGGDFCPKPCDPVVFGDPHFKTWHHAHEFEYHGECDLVFLKAPALDMDIHVRTTIRYDYSFVSQAAVRIGEEIFEVASWGEYQLDGMASVDLPAFIGGYPITKTQLAHKENLKVNFVIHLDQDTDISISSYKDYVAVRVENGTMDMYKGASGIMGDYETGSMFLRDGTVEEDPDIFAPEWQVRPEVDGVLFAGERAPVYPQKCVLPSPDAVSARARKLGEASISQEQAERACVRAEDKAACIEDVLKTQDLDMADAN